MTKFSKLVKTVDGKLVEVAVRYIPQSAMLQCPHCIMVADHYREDHTCRCNDKYHFVMKEWGYKWRNGKWEA